MRAGGRRDRWWSKLTGRWQDVVDEYEDGLLRAQLDSLPDHVNKLPRGEVSRHQVLLLVDIGDVAPPGLLHDDRDPVRVLLADPQGLGLAFLCARAREREREFKGSESGGKKERVSESRSLRKGASLSRRRGGGRPRQVVSLARCPGPGDREREELFGRGRDAKSGSACSRGRRATYRGGARS